MQETLKLTTTMLAVALLLASAQAQTKPATPPAKPKAAPSAAAKSSSSTAKKPATTAKTGAATPLTTQKEKFSYALGMNLGTSLQKQSVPVDPAILARGLRDALAGKTQMTEDEARAAIMAVQTEMRKKMEDSRQAAGATNKKEGEAFLAANKAKEGVTTLPSGLQYKILTAGTGPKPTATDSVVCNYRGTLINGKEFDSSYKRGQPATFPVNGVIKGWTEALQLMPVGSKWQLVVPPDLAYGDRGAGADIAPGATLIFEVELMSIQDKSKDPTPEKK
jgi:FKBP-type peptidyl-prolyl cis-trans isomerase FklB